MLRYEHSKDHPLDIELQQAKGLRGDLWSRLLIRDWYRRERAAGIFTKPITNPDVLFDIVRETLEGLPHE